MPPFLILVSLLALQGATPGDPYLATARALAAVEGDSAPAVEARWKRVLEHDRGNREALLGLFQLARLTSRLERADSLSRLLVARGREAPDGYGTAARLAMASSLVDGADPAIADSEFTTARREARAIAAPRLESEALLGLAQVRSRSAGVRVALELVAESRRLYAAATADEEAQRLCAEGSFRERLGDDRGRPGIQRGLELARQSGFLRTRGVCLLLRGQARLARGYNDLALMDLDSTVVYLRRAHAERQLAIALQWGAYVRYQRRDFASARRDFLESIVLARRTRNASVEAWAYTARSKRAKRVDQGTPRPIRRSHAASGGLTCQLAHPLPSPTRNPAAHRSSILASGIPHRR